MSLTLDIACVVLAAAFFALGVVLVHGCERLRGR